MIATYEAIGILSDGRDFRYIVDFGAPSSWVDAKGPAPAGGRLHCIEYATSNAPRSLAGFPALSRTRTSPRRFGRVRCEHSCVA